MNNREYEFRIKNRDSGGWAYFRLPHPIIWAGSWDLKSLGQYTGLKDKNGLKIYEGDICTCLGYEPAEIKFKLGAFRFSELPMHEISPNSLDLIEIKGNIFDNPELLK